MAASRSPADQPVGLSRRQLLRGAVRSVALVAAAATVAPLTACGRWLTPEEPEAPQVTITQGVPEPPVAPVTPTPESTPLPPPPQITLDPSEVGQGESAMVLVRQPGAMSGNVSLLGQRVPLIADGDLLWAVVGAGLLTPVAVTEAVVTTRGARGDLLDEVAVPLTVVAVDRPVDYLTASPEVTAVLTMEAAETEAALRTYEQFNRFQSRPLWDGALLMPCDGWITTEFGQGRSINGGPVTGHHSGTDIANASGTPIYTAASGRIAWAGWMPIRGNSVLVDHGAGVMTGYHHLLRVDVQEGRDVAAGDQIGRMGSTGFSTGPHLHWEMTVFGANVDPMTWTERVFLPSAVESRPASA